MRLSLLTETQKILKQHGFRPKKRLGQNFLVDEHVLEAVVEAAEIKGQETVIEIGPGLGLLTRQLCRAAGWVLAIELDPSLFSILKRQLAGFPNLSLVQSDVLAFDLESWLSQGGHQGKAKVVANLPYYLSTPLLFQLLAYRHLFSLWVLMVQKEVAERIGARPGSKDYGSLSIALQLYGEVEPVLSVSKEAFYPRPQVDSAVLKIRMREEPRAKIEDETLFRELVRSAFSQRRKMLRNALARQMVPGLKQEVWERAFANAGIASQRRGETLSIEEFARLANQLHRERERDVSHR
ncbi:MAG: 16S rRNA (adenine(1518)-N(6)/adenine(1519)-N(6))-dimethyltransferase RsmA [candidate division NC10 bacterium]|nr:16S rRNA (adenine(1518)-N(6)/adenine(1519)-N(6))-dimethyltransferase RsmA [candidate division NC10 bacterium]